MKKLAQIALALVFMGCANDFNHPKIALNDGKKSTIFFSIKSAAIALSGTGFVQQKNGAMVINLYSGARHIGKILAGENKVCVNLECVQNRSFNSRVLGVQSDEALMLKMLNSAAIFSDEVCVKHEKSRKIFTTNKAKIIIKSL